MRKVFLFDKMFWSFLFYLLKTGINLFALIILSNYVVIQAMQSFSPSRTRDAYPTIRGFVYQVNLTLKRWLTLQPDQILELERGEDIDIVSNLFSASDSNQSDEEESRILEQIKHLEVNITLRQPGVLSALSNALEHFNAHEGHNLVFRYTTNSHPGIEQLSPIPNRTAAIVAWQKIYESSCSGEENTVFIAGIRSILLLATRPTDLPQTSWDTFQKFVQNATDAQFEEFIHRFEFGTNTGEVREVGEEIKQFLLDQGYAANNNEAQRKYETLFFYVFDKLTQPEIKRLTTLELTQQLNTSSLADEQQAIINNIFTTLKNLSEEVVELKQGQFELKQVQQESLARLGSVEGLLDSFISGDNTNLEFKRPVPFLNIPPLVTIHTKRSKTVLELQNKLTLHWWLAIYGVQGVGKTQLVLLLLQTLNTPVVWLGFDGSDVQKAAEGLDNACRKLLGLSVWDKNTDYELYLELCRKHARGGIIVLDNLPRFIKQDELGTRLNLLLQACQATDVRMISTSLYDVPTALSLTAGSNTLHSLPCPPFTTEEVAELFYAYGSPPNAYSEKAFNSFNSQAYQHPLFLIAMIEYLRRQSWNVTDEVFESLFLRKEYAQELNEENLQLLLEHVQDSTSRDYLYRLNLILTSFTLEIAQLLAQVEPVIDRPRERFNTLLGPWIHRDTYTKNQFLVSPLIKGLGRGDLSQSTEQACFSLLAQQILAKGQLDQYDFNPAFHYLTSAKEFNQAAQLLLSALMSLRQLDRLVPDTFILSLWYGLPLPVEIDFELRLLLRAFQIAVCTKYHKDTAYLVKDLESLINQANQTHWKALILVAVNAPLNATQANYYTYRALQAVRQYNSSSPSTGNGEVSGKMPYELILWLHVLTFKTSEDVSNWLNNFELLSEEQRSFVFSQELTEVSALGIVDNIWLYEADKPLAEQNWVALDLALDKLVAQAWQLKLFLLWACLIRAKIIVTSEYLKDLPSAISTAELALSQAPKEDNRVLFLIEECLGRQFIYAKQNNQALVWLNKAFTHSTTAFARERVFALLWASVAISESDTGVAVNYCQQAVEIASNNDNISEDIKVKALGELSIALWRNGTPGAAYDPLSQIGAELLEVISTSEVMSKIWRNLYVIFGLTLATLTPLVSYGDPVGPVEVGRQPTQQPVPGIFLSDADRFSPYYKDSQASYLAVLLSSFAQAINRDSDAANWASRGLEMALSDKQNFALSALTLRIAPQLVLSDRYAEVIEGTINSSAQKKAIEKQNEEGRNVYSLAIDVEAELGSKPNKLWQEAEYDSLPHNMLPIMFRLGYLRITDASNIHHKASEVVTLCRGWSNTSSDPKLWNSVANIVEQTFITNANSADLIDLANQFAQNKQPYLQLMALLGSILAKDILPETAFRLSFEIMPFLEKGYQNNVIYRKLIWPFVYHYWQDMITTKGFRINGPALVNEGLKRVHENSQEEGGKILAALKVIGSSFHVPASLVVEVWEKKLPK